MPPQRPRRFWWVYSGVTAVAGVTAQVALWVLPRDYPLWAHMVLAVSIGLLAGSAWFHFWKLTVEYRVWSSVRHLPKSIHVEQQGDGSIVAFVETLAGEPRILTLPEDYDPREDQGRHLIELLSEPES